MGIITDLIITAEARKQNYLISGFSTNKGNRQK
jgi:hypothetical protein